MLTAYLFDQRHGESVAAWADALQHLEGSQVLWLDLLDISDAEEGEVKDALGLEDLEICGVGHEIPVLTQREDYLEVTAVCVAEAKDGSAPQPIPIHCFVGENWVLTSHAGELALIDEFRERAEGKGEIGVLDAPTFLASLLGSVITSYQRAFDKIEMDLEDFDLDALRSARGDTERRIGVLVDVRRQLGALRRSLVPTVRSSSRSASASSIPYRPSSQHKGSTTSPSRPTRRWPPPSTRKTPSPAHLMS